MTTQRQTTQTVTREEIDLDVMLERPRSQCSIFVNAAGKDTCARRRSGRRRSRALPRSG